MGLNETFKSLDNITKKRGESEKVTEKFLHDQVVKLGGTTFKAPIGAGFPDRICMLGEGNIFFVEAKSEGQKPRKQQLERHTELRNLGFRVYTVDTKASVRWVLKTEVMRTA